MVEILATIVPTLGVIITTFIQVSYSKRKDKIEEKLTTLEESFIQQVTDLKKELKSDIDKLKNDNDIETLGRCKADLVSLMSNVMNGYDATTEAKMLLYETKELYNSKGGDSYVDSMFDKLKEEGKI